MTPLHEDAPLAQSRGRGVGTFGLTFTDDDGPSMAEYLSRTKKAVGDAPLVDEQGHRVPVRSERGHSNG